MKKFVLMAAILQFTQIAIAQNIESKIDEIFYEWNKENHPGGVIAILKNDELIFSKAYGFANIKYDIKNSEETIFNIGSVSKQFTALGIVLLQLEGKISFDDDIRKYLPELFEFETKITIRHLLHHTSGFRSSPELFGLAGWRDGDVITSEDDFRYLCKQTSLNFAQGSQFMYSNSGYILLAKIIERVSNQDFKTWMKDNVFSPLELNSTFVDQTNSNTNPKIATPYNEIGDQQFIIGENTSLCIGASNIYTTASNLIKWMKNFKSPHVNFKLAFELLQTTDTLSNGEINNYTFGVVKDDFYGNKRVQHTGGVPGFLSYAMYYPEENLIMVILTNFTSNSVNEKFEMLSQLFLDNNTVKIQKPVKIKELPLDLKAAKTIVGDYWNLKENYSRKIFLEHDTLWYLRDNGVKSQLIQTGFLNYKIAGIKTLVTVSFDVKEHKGMKLKDGERAIQYFEEYDRLPFSPEEIEEYSGTFYCSELETSYSISNVKGQLSDIIIDMENFLLRF
jgi:CubicO group peptidase (beta-lactamase class C family)